MRGGVEGGRVGGREGGRDGGGREDIGEILCACERACA